MSDNFITFFSLSLLYCVIILCLTYLFIYKKVKLPLQNIVAFGAGVLSILVVTDFLPHIFITGSSVYKSISLILAGLLVNAFSEIFLLPRMKFLNRLLPAEKHDCHQHDSQHVHYHLMPSSVGCSAVACLILCAFFDGIRFATTLMIDTETGVLMSIGLLFHLLPESVTVVGIGLSSGFSRKSLLNIIFIFCLAFLGGYQVFFLLSHLEHLQHFILPFAFGLFVYVCLVHLIPMVIKLKIKRWFFVGASVCFILSRFTMMMLPH